MPTTTTNPFSTPYGVYHIHKIMCGPGIWGHRCYYLDYPIGNPGDLWSNLVTTVNWHALGLSYAIGEVITAVAIIATGGMIAIQLAQDAIKCRTPPQL
jgi:hypothetical protein